MKAVITVTFDVMYDIEGVCDVLKMYGQTVIDFEKLKAYEFLINELRGVLERHANHSSK